MKTTKKLVGENDWSVYVLVNVTERWEGASLVKVKHYYTGISNNVTRRVNNHNAGRCKATRGRHWVMVGHLPGLTKAQAAACEKWLKTGDTVAKRARLYAAFGEAVHDECAGQKFWQTVDQRMRVYEVLREDFT